MNTYQLIASMKSQFAASTEEYVNNAIDRYIREMFCTETFQEDILNYFDKLKNKNIEVNIAELLSDALIYPANTFNYHLSYWENIDDDFQASGYIYIGEEVYQYSLKLWDLLENKDEDEVNEILLNKFTDGIGTYVSDCYMDILKQYDNVEFCQIFLKYIENKEWRDIGTKTPDEVFGDDDWGF